MFGKPRIKATAIFLAALLFSPLAASQLDISLPDVDCKNPSEWFGAGSGNPGGGPSNSLTDATGCEGQDGAASRNDNSPDQGTGNPINVISGNKFLREVDYANKRGGLGLEFVRYYNSRNQKNFRLGVGWSYSFNTVVVGVRTLKPSDQKQIQVHQADGRNLYFTREKNTDLLRTDLQSDGHIKTTDIGYTWHWPNGRQLYFDDRGLLDNITQGNAQIDLHRNADGQLLAAEDQNGRRLSFRFQQGYLAYVKTPDGRKIKFRYYKSGHLVEVERAAGAIRKYEYNHPGNNALLTKVTNEKGQTIGEYRYNKEEKTSYSAKGRGREAVSVKYLPPEEGSSKRITRVSNGLGAVTDYHIEDISGRDMVVRVSGQGCAACASTGVSYRFSDRYQVLEKANDNGSAEIYEYDELGRRTSRYYRNRQGEKSLQLRVSYNGGSHNPSKIEESSIAPGRFFSRNLSYNDKGQLISIKESGYAPKLNAKQLASLDFSQGFDEFQFSPVERTTKLLYNQQGQLSQIDGPLPGTGDIIKLEYDNNHKLISVTGPDGRKMQILAYDSDGRPTKAQYNQQPAIEMNYTDKGDIATVTQNGRQFQYQYSITGKLKQVISPDGNSLKLHYDDSDTATGFTGPDGRRFHSDLDAEGRRINSQIFDRQGQLLEKIAYAYDAYGRLAGVDKGNEQAHTIQYGKAGEVLTQS